MSRLITNEYLGVPKILSREELLRELNPGEKNSGLMFGYLGVDEDLEQIIDLDKQILDELGLTYDYIANKIEELFLSNSDIFNGNYIIRREFIHSPVCPWGDYCTISPFDFSKKTTEIILLNGEKLDMAISFLGRIGDFGLSCFPDLVKNDFAMIFSDLHPHLIRDHHFFEGYKTPYRVDPRRAKRYLNL